MQRRYDRYITIQRKTVTQSASGEEIATWADIVRNIPAFVAPTKGSEKRQSPEDVAEQEVTFTIRWHSIPSAFRPLAPEDRILYPVDALGADAQRPGTAKVYEIVSPDEVGRQVDLSIKTIRRADVFGDNTDEGTFPGDGEVTDDDYAAWVAAA
jgi:head-tail adaptor